MNNIWKYAAALALLCPLSIATVYQASTALSGSAAFCVAVCVDLVAGYAILLALSAEESKVAPVQPVVIAEKAKRSIAPPQKAAQKPAKPRKPEVAKQSLLPAEPRKTEQAAQGDDIVARLATLPALANIDRDDIRKVVAEHRKGTRRSDIYKALHWASAKHSKIVKPVVAALVALELQREQ